MRFQGDSALKLKLIDYNSARFIPNKKAGLVVDVIGDTEFCAPELLSFEPVNPGSDMWAVAIIMYILLSGISPFYEDDEDLIVKNVQTCKYVWKGDWDNNTSEARDFIKNCLKRAPESRMTAQAALEHKWLSDEYKAQRQNSKLADNQKDMLATDERLLEEEAEDYIWGSFVFKTFDEEEFNSPEDSDDEEEE